MADVLWPIWSSHLRGQKARIRSEIFRHVYSPFLLGLSWLLGITIAVVLCVLVSVSVTYWALGLPARFVSFISICGVAVIPTLLTSFTGFLIGAHRKHRVFAYATKLTTPRSCVDGLGSTHRRRPARCELRADHVQPASL